MCVGAGDRPRFDPGQFRPNDVGPTQAGNTKQKRNRRRPCVTLAATAV